MEASHGRRLYGTRRDRAREIAWIRWEIYVCRSFFTGSQDAQKGRPARPQTEQEPEAYPLGYVEDSCELRTPLADFFSILLKSDADFIQVSEQVGRVLIDPIGSCPFQLLPAIAPGEQSH
jgi:hypothetical protein